MEGTVLSGNPNDLNPGGSGGAWHDGLAPELAQHPSFEKFKGVSQADLFKSYVDLEKTVGADGRVTIPGPEATEEEKDAFAAKLGVPKDVAGYQFEALPEVVKALPQATKMDTEFANIALKARLTPEQAKIIRDWHVGNTQAEIAANEADLAGHKTETEKLFKEKLGDRGYADLISSAHRAIVWAEDPELIADLNSGLGNVPSLVRLLSKVGGMVSDPSFKGGNTRGSFITPEAARKEIAAIYSDPKHPYNSKVDPEGHREAVSYVQRLHEIAYPPES